MRFLFLLFLFVSPAAFGQQFVGLAVKRGFVIPHRPILKQLISGPATTIDLTYERKLTGFKPWHEAYGFPTAGYSFAYSDLGNPTQLGKVYSFTPFLKLGFNKQSPFSLKFGIGLAYLTKKYERLENHKNGAIGSHVNASILLGINGIIVETRTLEIASGIQLQHYSNGSVGTPNLGLNIPSVYLGVRFKATEHSVKDFQPVSANDTQQSYTFINPKVGVKELLVTGNKKWVTYTLHAGRSIYLSPKLDYQLFGDVMYNSSLQSELADKGIAVDNQASLTQFGLGAGVENKYGSLRFYLQMAVYLQSRQVDVGRLYHRLGMKKVYGSRYFWNIGIKSHFAKADFLEIGWGLKL